MPELEELPVPQDTDEELLDLSEPPFEDFPEEPFETDYLDVGGVEPTQPLNLPEAPAPAPNPANGPTPATPADVPPVQAPPIAAPPVVAPPVQQANPAATATPQAPPVQPFPGGFNPQRKVGLEEVANRSSQPLQNPANASRINLPWLQTSAVSDQVSDDAGFVSNFKNEAVARGKEELKEQAKQRLAKQTKKAATEVATEAVEKTASKTLSAGGGDILAGAAQVATEAAIRKRLGNGVVGNTATALAADAEDIAIAIAESETIIGAVLAIGRILRRHWKILFVLALIQAAIFYVMGLALATLLGIGDGSSRISVGNGSAFRGQFPDIATDRYVIPDPKDRSKALATLTLPNTRGLYGCETDAQLSGGKVVLTSRACGAVDADAGAALSVTNAGGSKVYDPTTGTKRTPTEEEVKWYFTMRAGASVNYWRKDAEKTYKVDDNYLKGYWFGRKIVVYHPGKNVGAVLSYLEWGPGTWTGQPANSGKDAEQDELWGNQYLVQEPSGYIGRSFGIPSSVIEAMGIGSNDEEIVVGFLKPELEATTPLGIVENIRLTGNTPFIGDGSQVVVVDPGHGGHDGGATVTSGGKTHKESLIALQISNLVSEELQRRNIRAIQTRNTDSFIEIPKRAEISNDARASAFLSIHLNSSSNSSAKGYELYYSVSQANAGNTSGKEFATAISDGLASFDLIEQRSTSVKGDTSSQHSGGLGVLRANDRPAALLETGFITNSGDLAVLSNPIQQRLYAQAIAEAIASYLGG